MTIWPGLSTSLVALVLGGAGAAQAQDLTHVLQNGRTIVVPVRTEVCGAPEQEAQPRFAIAAWLNCRDAISGVGGTGYVLVGREGGQTTPREFLATVAAEMFPDASAAEQAEEIRSVQTEFSGDTYEMLCVAGRDREGTFGDATCVLAQPRTQVILNGRSTGIEQAYGVIVMFLSGVTIRP
jgi:hypothetical protein